MPTTWLYDYVVSLDMFSGQHFKFGDLVRIPWLTRSTEHFRVRSVDLIKNQMTIHPVELALQGIQS